MKKMNKAALVAATLAALSSGTAGAVSRSELSDQFAQSRKAAEHYYDLQAALDAGYEPLFDCTTHGDLGAMGQHYINTAFAADGELSLEKPDVLMYEPQADGSMHLVALEYVVFESQWESPAPPRFLGRTLARKDAVGQHPVDPFYEVHVWHWRHNPAGLTADYNTDVSCDDG
jgi:hypothetical protein